MRKITGVLVNTETNEIGVKTIDKSLEGYYKALNCTCIDVASREIGGEQFDIVCDDEGLLKAHPVVSAIDSDGQPVLVGNLFIVKFDGQDDVRSLDKAEIETVLHNTAVVRQGSNLRLVIHPCNY